jgi:hydroxymethylbilane synthase
MADIKLKIGTRGSPLALAQAHETRDRLARAHGADPAAFEIVVIRTSGDMIQDRALSEAGGKGLFTKEIDIAMLRGEIDIAVHSSKDLPTALPEGIFIAGFLPREDARDALIAPRSPRFADLPRGARLGTASLRRQAMAKRLRPDLEVSLLRGNVQTRLGKAESGEIDATLLAYAGLRRLGLADRATAVLEIEDFLPAVGQGAIGITARPDDTAAAAALAPILHAETGVALAAERAFLTVLDGSCKTPIAGHARMQGGRVVFRGLVLRTDGSEAWEVADDGRPEDAAEIGGRAGRDLKARLPDGVVPTA